MLSKEIEFMIDFFESINSLECNEYYDEFQYTVIFKLQWNQT